MGKPWQLDVLVIDEQTLTSAAPDVGIFAGGEGTKFDGKGSACIYSFQGVVTVFWHLS